MSCVNSSIGIHYNPFSDVGKNYHFNNTPVRVHSHQASVAAAALMLGMDTTDGTSNSDQASAEITFESIDASADAWCELGLKTQIYCFVHCASRYFKI